MATSKQIKGYAKANNCSNAEASAHFVKEAMDNFLFKMPKSTEGFRPDAGTCVYNNRTPGVVLNVSQFVAGSLETHQQFGGVPYRTWKDGLEVTDTVGVIGNEESEGTDFCATLWFSKEMFISFTNEIEKGAFNIELLGTPKSMRESGQPGDAFRPIKVTEVRTRGCYSDAGGKFTTMCLAGTITHGEFAKNLRKSLASKVRVA